MRRWAATGLAVLLLAAPAWSQTADVPVMGSSAEQDSGAGDEQQVREVLVLGDALAGGLGAGLARVTAEQGRYDVAIRFNEESGLARPEVYDWSETLPKILASNSYDVIVVMLGTNDRQMIRSGNLRLGFDSAPWAEAYGKRVDVLLDELAASGAKIVWVGQPPMQDPDYDAAMKAISAIQKAHVEARGMTFLDMRAPLAGADGGFADSGPDETGEVRKLRASDGVSFFKAGNNRMGQLVLQAIESGAALPEQKTAKAEAAPQPPAGGDSAAPAPDVPVFGQAMTEGDPLTVQPSDVRANAMVVAHSDVAPAAALSAIRALAPQGSAADRLFRRGEASPAPPGRADDFAAPPPAND